MEDQECKISKVIIGLDEIKIVKVKMKTVLDWPFLKIVKGIQKFLRLANYKWFVKNFVKNNKMFIQVDKKSLLPNQF